MSVLVSFLSIASFILAAVAFSKGESAVHQILAAILFVGGIIGASATAILVRLHEAEKRALQAQEKPAPTGGIINLKK